MNAHKTGKKIFSQMVLFALILQIRASKTNNKVLKDVIWAEYQSCGLS